MRLYIAVLLSLAQVITGGGAKIGGSAITGGGSSVSYSIGNSISAQSASSGSGIVTTGSITISAGQGIAIGVNGCQGSPPCSSYDVLCCD